MSKMLIDAETIKGLVHGIYEGNELITGGIAQGLSKLPFNYTQLQYIESKSENEAYLKLPIHGFGNLGIELDFKTSNPISDTNYGCIIGCRNSTNTYEYQLNTLNNKNTGIFRYNSNEYAAGIKSNTRMTFKFIRVSDVQMRIETTNEFIDFYEFYNNAELSLFALNSSANSENNLTNFSNTKIYSLKLYLDEYMIADYTPCKNNNGEIGLYDSYCHQFYKGVNLTAGPEVKPQNNSLVFDKATNMTKYNNDNICSAALNMFNDTLPELDPPESVTITQISGDTYTVKITNNPNNYQYVFRYLVFLNNEHVGDIEGLDIGSYDGTFQFPRALKSGDKISIQSINSVDLFEGPDTSAPYPLRRWRLSKSGSRPILSINSKFKPSRSYDITIS